MRVQAYGSAIVPDGAAVVALLVADQPPVEAEAGIARVCTERRVVIGIGTGPVAPHPA